MASRSIGVYVEFQEEFCEQLRRLASHLATAGSGEEGYRPPSYLVRHPHLTLFHAVVRDPDLESIRKSVDRINRYCKNEPVRFLNQVKMFGDKFLFYDVVRTPMLEMAHASAVVALLPFVDHQAAQPATKEELTLTRSERRNLKTFGYSHVGEDYRPHVTLAFDDESSRVIKRCVSLVPPTTTFIQAVKLGIMGDYGSLQESL